MTHFVQFMHPGQEPDLVVGRQKPWNHGSHRRSFLTSSGMAISESQEMVQSSLLFWGEWEGPALATLIGGNEPGQPMQLFVPISESCPVNGKPQNTDPFVFGAEFLYCCCKQVRRNGTRTYLSSLQRGDVILFGSSLHHQFVLDTVLVVASDEGYDPRGCVSTFRGRVPAEFEEATLRPLSHVFLGRRAMNNVDSPCSETSWVEDDEECSEGCSLCDLIVPHFQLYRGATFREPVDGMFSFVPAKRLSDSPNGFARPSLDLDLVNANLGMGFRECLADRDPRDHFAAWDEIRNAVCNKGLLLGVQIDLPQRGTQR